MAPLRDSILEVAASHEDREQLALAVAARSGYSVTSSSFANAIGKLRSLALIEGRGDFTASKDLFE